MGDKVQLVPLSSSVYVAIVSRSVEPKLYSVPFENGYVRLDPSPSSKDSDRQQCGVWSVVRWADAAEPAALQIGDVLQFMHQEYSALLSLGVDSLDDGSDSRSRLMSDSASVPARNSSLALEPEHKVALSALILCLS